MPKRYIPALVFVIALAICTTYFYVQESRFIEGMALAQGKVQSLGAGSSKQTSAFGKSVTTPTQAIVAFRVEGKTYKSRGRAMGLPAWLPGDTVGVYYNPQDPRQSRIQRFDELYFHSLIPGMFLLGALLFASINFLVYKLRGRPLS
ncbi:MAG: DUF3592 domain-containing protein [Nevskiales bacterium]